MQNRNLKNKILRAFLLAIIILTASARFVHISADFPTDITNSKALYTDEGWYTSGAINLFTTGSWHKEGDFNPMINMPIAHLIQAGTFSIFGMNIVSARSTVAVFFLLILISVWFIVVKYIDKEAAVYSCLFLATNFFLFSYSRFATADVMMLGFTMISILIVSHFSKSNDFIVIGFATLFLGIAYLTKNSALFGLPLLMYFATLRSNRNKEKTLYSIYSAVLFIIIISTYSYVIFQYFPEDFKYFNSLNISNRSTFNPYDIVFNFWNHLKSGAATIGLVVTIITLTLSFILTIKDKYLWKNPLLTVSILWGFIYLGMISVTNYNPPRYYLPLSIPIAFLFGISISSLRKNVSGSAIYITKISLIVLLLYTQGSQILFYLDNTKYSFVEMSREVKQIVNQKQNAEKNVIAGHFAYTTSIITNLPSINSNFSTKNNKWKVKKYNPDYYISLGHPPKNGILNSFSDFKMIRKWDSPYKINNLKKVYLLKLIEQK